MNEHPEIWAPLTGMPDGAEAWAMPGFDELAAEWHEHRQAMKSNAAGQRFMDGWLRERIRAFAIETGQIEGLYTLRRGVTEQLVAEGFASAVGAHTLEDLDDGTIRGLLMDQEAAYDMMFDDVASGRGLSLYMLKSWHQLLTRHQETVAGIDIKGRRVQVPFHRKGEFKIKPNNPRRRDGVIHQYCPPEQVDVEMERFVDLYANTVEGRYPVNVEAAWLHHRFVRTHPFQDGNGRVSRLLMAWAYVRQHLPPPVIAAQEKLDYIDVLELADVGDLRAFSDHIGDRAITTLRAAVRVANNVRDGRMNRPNGNGGRTIGDTYYPPLPGGGVLL